MKPLDDAWEAKLALAAAGQRVLEFKLNPKAQKALCEQAGEDSPGPANDGDRGVVFGVPWVVDSSVEWIEVRGAKQETMSGKTGKVNGVEFPAQWKMPEDLALDQ